ncbi:hypothetical protein GGR56DRAFT_683148 [Xylariaceae sp. FL0804]|nr:hypothetical protein GGR56DRAFT_683148 [Xylariaceae sp. FL0804]
MSANQETMVTPAAPKVVSANQEKTVTLSVPKVPETSECAQEKALESAKVPPKWTERATEPKVSDKTTTPDLGEYTNDSSEDEEPSSSSSSSSRRAARRGRKLTAAQSSSLARALLRGRAPIGDTHSFSVKERSGTGCFGWARVLKRRRRGTRARELHVAHAAGCKCRDVTLHALCAYADKLARHGQIPEGDGGNFRDLLVLHLKLRMPLDDGGGHVVLPWDIRKRLRSQQINRPRGEVEEEVEMQRVLDEYCPPVGPQQKLVEEWKNLEAYRQRKIWKDW